MTDGPTYPSSETWERIRGIVLVLIVNFLQSTLVEFELSAPIASFILYTVLKNRYENADALVIDFNNNDNNINSIYSC